MAPDLAYAFNRPGFELNAHIWPAAVFVAIPIATLAAWYVRWLAPTTFRQLPPALGVDWRTFETLGRPGPGLRITVWSAAVGVGTHVFWDGLTHTTRWGAQLWPWFAEASWLGYPPAKVFQYASHVGGALVALLLLSRIPTPANWNPTPVTGSDRVSFWIAVTAGAAVGFGWGLGDFFAALIIKTSIGAATGLGMARLRSSTRSLEPQGS